MNKNVYNTVKDRHSLTFLLNQINFQQYDCDIYISIFFQIRTKRIVSYMEYSASYV